MRCAQEARSGGRLLQGTNLVKGRPGHGAGFSFGAPETGNTAPAERSWQGAFDHENRKTPISKPAANAQRPNVQAETRRTRLRRSSSDISWDRSVIAGRPLRWPLGQPSDFPRASDRSRKTRAIANTETLCSPSWGCLNRPVLILLHVGGSERHVQAIPWGAQSPLLN